MLMLRTNEAYSRPPSFFSSTRTINAYKESITWEYETKLCVQMNYTDELINDNPNFQQFVCEAVVDKMKLYISRYLKEHDTNEYAFSDPTFNTTFEQALLVYKMKADVIVWKKVSAKKKPRYQYDKKKERSRIFYEEERL